VFPFGATNLQRLPKSRPCMPHGAQWLALPSIQSTGRSASLCLNKRRISHAFGPVTRRWSIPLATHPKHLRSLHSAPSNRDFLLSDFPPPLIRSFAIISHVDHGKSTLSDRLLELTNTIRMDAPNAQVLDKLQVERESVPFALLLRKAYFSPDEVSQSRPRQRRCCIKPKMATRIC
jgi:hypothetical protein